MKLVWNKRTHRGFFLRAEDFFGYTKRLRALAQDLMTDLKQVESDFQEPIRLCQKDWPLGRRCHQ